MAGRSMPMRGDVVRYGVHTGIALGEVGSRGQRRGDVGGEPADIDVDRVQIVHAARFAAAAVEKIALAVGVSKGKVRIGQLDGGSFGPKMRLITDGITHQGHPVRMPKCTARRDRSVESRHYASGFSKSLASNVRVGYLACRAHLADTLAGMKVLRGFNTPELNERLVHALLVEGKFTRHAQMLRRRLAGARVATRSLLMREGVEFLGDPLHGMFYWVNAGGDTNKRTASLREQGLVVAPGSLFSLEQVPSEWMRLNVTTPLDITAALTRSGSGRGDGACGEGAMKPGREARARRGLEGASGY